MIVGLDSMAKNKGKFVKKYQRLLKDPKSKESDLNEAERKLSEDTSESDEGLGIEEDEAAGEEAYPEIEEAIKEESDEDEN